MPSIHLSPVSLPSTPGRDGDATRLDDLIVIHEAEAPNLAPGLEQAIHHVATSELRAEAGDAEAALADARRAFALAPEAVTGRYLREAAGRAGDEEAWLAGCACELSHVASRAYRAKLQIACGRQAERRGAPAEALAAYERALDLEEGVEAAIAAERLAVDMGRWWDAARFATTCARALGDAQASSECWSRAARYLLQADERDKAMHAVARARELAPSGPGVWLARELLALANPAALGELREEQAKSGILPRAEAALDAAITRLHVLGDPEGARASLEAGLEDAEGELRAFFLQELSHRLDPLKDRDAWIDCMRERLDVEERPAARAHVGFALAQHAGQDDPSEALELLGRVLTDAPAHAPALELAVHLHMSAGQHGQVLALLRRDAEAPDAPQERAEALARVAELLVDVPGVEAEAIELLWDGLDVLGDDLGLSSALERALVRAEDWEGLRRCYRRAAESAKDPARRHWLLTQIARVSHERLGDRDGATEALEEAAWIDAQAPLAVDSLRQLALLLDEEEDGARLEDTLERLASLVPSPAEAASHRMRLAMLRERRGDIEGAVALLADELELAPPTHPVHRMASRLLHEQGRHDEVLRSLERAAERSAGIERARWLHRAAELLGGRLGRAEDALERLRRAARLAPDDDAIGVALAEGLARAGCWQELATHYAHDDAPLSLLARAGALEGLGQREEALAAYAAACERGLTAARTPRLRLAAALERWEDIRATYAAWDPTSPAVEVATRYAAAAVARERCADRETALAIAREASAASAGALPVELLRLSLLPSGSEERAEVLRALAEGVEARLHDAALRELAAEREAHDPVAAGPLWVALAFQRPEDPIASVAAHLHLARVGDDVQQVELLQHMGDRGAELADVLEPVRTLRLARARQRLDAPRAAADAFGAARRLPGRPLLSFVERPALLGALESREAFVASCEELGARLGGGAAAACVFRFLADRARHDDDLEAARGYFERALAAHPTDYWALRSLEETCAAIGPSESALDALVRAAEAEPDARRRAAVAAHAGRRLYEAGRVGLARDLLERAVAADPESLAGLVWLAELTEQGGDTARLYEVVQRIAEAASLESETRAHALRRWIQLALEEYDDLASAQRAAGLLGALAPGDASIDEVRLAAARAADDHAAIAGVLTRLVALSEITEGARVEYLMELAHVQAEKLDDAASAIRALGRAQTTEARELAADRLFELGQRSSRWTLVTEALESAFSSADGIDPRWETTLRRRLADVLHDTLSEPEGALHQLRRVLELTPGDVAALRRVAELSGDESELRRVRRSLFATQPTDAGLLRQLRTDFLAAGDLDGAFSAEAVAVGLGVASEEEAYFHQQRRGLLPSGPGRQAVEPSALLSVGASTIGPVGRLLDVLEPALLGIFPTDLSSYGLVSEALAARDPALQEVVDEVGALFGQDGLLAVRAGPGVGPAVERHGDRTLIILPAELAGAAYRERRFVIACLVYRAAIRATWSDPLRANAVQPRYVPHLVSAALRILDGRSSEDDHVVARDMRARMEREMSDEMRAGAAEARQAVRVAPEEVDGWEILRSMSVAAGRAGMLAAQDPAVAIAAMRRWPGMFRRAGDTSGDGELPLACMEVIPYALSESLAELRATVGLGLPSGSPSPGTPSAGTPS